MDKIVINNFKCFFYSLIILRDIGFMWKMTFQIFTKSLRFETYWMSPCRHRLKAWNFWKNYRIGLRFGILFEGPKEKDEFVNQLFFTNGSGFFHQNRFYKSQKFNFPAKIYEIWKKCLETKLFILKRSTTSRTVLYSSYTFKLFLVIWY